MCILSTLSCSTVLHGSRPCTARARKLSRTPTFNAIVGFNKCGSQILLWSSPAISNQFYMSITPGYQKLMHPWGTRKWFTTPTNAQLLIGQHLSECRLGPQVNTVCHPTCTKTLYPTCIQLLSEGGNPSLITSFLVNQRVH